MDSHFKWVLSVASFYKYLVKNSIEEDKFPFTQIWEVNSQPRITFFAWEVGRGSILTINKLIRRGKIMVKGCYLRKKAEETRDHILLQCSFVTELIRKFFGVYWIMAGSVKDEL